MKNFKYHEIQRYISEGIKSGVFTQKLPSIRCLAQEKSVSISTIQKAYEALEFNGEITAKPQKGYFVSHKPGFIRHNYGNSYTQADTKSALEQQVLYSLNDDKIIPLSSTAPSSVINNESLITKHHKKSFNSSIYRFQIEDEIQGQKLLRQNISQLLFRQNTLIDPNNIIISTGRREGLLLALIATECIGRKVAVESPTSFFFHSTIGQICQNVIEVPMQSTYESEIELLDQAYREHKFNVYVVNPSFNDPTGRLLSTSEKLSLLQWAEKRNVTLIEYDRSELYFGDTKPQSLAQLSKQTPNVSLISICDFFDTISTRIYLGYVIAINCRDKLLRVKQTISEEPSLQTQQLLNSMISSGDYENLLVKLRRQLKTNYLNTVKLLKEELSVDVHFNAVGGGPCLWLHSPKMQSSKLWQSLIKKQVAIAPGAMFSFKENYENFLRITFALPWNADLIIALKKLCKEI